MTGVLAALGLACGGSPTEPGTLDTLVAVSLDELAGVHASQNVPGTSDEHPNWRRRTERSRTALNAPATLKALSTLADARRVASSKGD